ncbi:hypothetical protein BAURA86_00418 [Brevibacterium aurantiacum]|uniref:Uncharacterized protein n=1 Tax=Brevibacterium aurantiacum TaxID=273384 RepID=A0A2H1IAZ4_BREAU|nr:hypothetical protein BAURA86_00418 [Brevibacterium aurantiacum]
MQFGDTDLRSLGRLGRIGRQESTDALYCVIYEHEAMGQSMLQIDSLQLFKASGVVVMRDRPPRPRVLVKSQRKCVRCRRQIGRCRISDGVTHSINLTGQESTEAPMPDPDVQL